MVSIFQRLIQGVEYMILIRLKGLNDTLMQTLLEDGTDMTGNGQIMFYLDLAMPYFMLGAQYYGQVNCKRKFL